MKLMEHLSEYDKDELKKLGKELGVTLPASENAQKWRERIAETIVKPEFVESRLVTLTDSQITLFERACEGMFIPEENQVEDKFAVEDTYCAFPYEVKSEEHFDFQALLKEGIGHPKKAEEIANKFVDAFRNMLQIYLSVPEEIVPVYREIDTPEFQRRRHVSAWLKVCVEVCGKLYAVTPVSVLARVYALEEPVDEAELRQILRRLPHDADAWVYDEDADRVLCRPMDDTELQTILDSQGDREFCLPKLESMQDLSSGYYPFTLPAYQCFRDFLKEYCGMDYWDADGYVRGLWDTLLEDENDREGDLQWLIDVTGTDPKIMPLLAKLYENCMRVTPCIAYRGHTREEVLSPDALAVRPGNFNFDFEMGAPKIRIGRNDPCPCGSGKKFKKCCGR